eukprot:TRINITY_DN4323_c0_g1_i12.p2 TRINITY_DN4323_c0_g1~~TRINITY_DN4323_c0_g1_i12.p2  ORF type:complete len:258 (+),score=-12.45 TRINITY_DN4323_c0_g1_i12:1631-2404(+)
MAKFPLIFNKIHWHFNKCEIFSNKKANTTITLLNAKLTRTIFQKIFNHLSKHKIKWCQYFSICRTPFQNSKSMVSIFLNLPYPFLKLNSQAVLQDKSSQQRFASINTTQHCIVTRINTTKNNQNQKKHQQQLAINNQYSPIQPRIHLKLIFIQIHVLNLGYYLRIYKIFCVQYASITTFLFLTNQQATKQPISQNIYKLKLKRILFSVGKLKKKSVLIFQKSNEYSKLILLSQDSQVYKYIISHNKIQILSKGKQKF